MTVDEFWEFGNRPENEPRHLDLIAGEVIAWPIPFKKHGVVCARIGYFLAGYLERSRIGYGVAGNAGVILSREPATVVGPDLAVYPHAAGAEDERTGWSTDPPILAVEVLSANDDVSQMPPKIDECLRAGVKVVWLADPEVKAVTVYRPKHHHTVLKGDAELTGGDELPGFSCKVSDFFRLPGDQAPTPPSPPPPGS